MNYQLVEVNGKTYVECLPGGGMLVSEREALELVAACGENTTHRLMIPAEVLPDAFFQLSTRLAGEVMLKLSNYRIRCAAVIPAEISHRGRFGEMVLETNRGKQLRVHPDRAAAEAWLLEG